MERRNNWDDYTPAEQGEIKAAMDVLASIFPLGMGRPARNAYWSWVQSIVEMRAKSIQQV